MTQEDIIDRWVRDRCMIDPQAVTLSVDLYRDYERWANGRRLYVSSIHRLVRHVASRAGVARWAQPRTRRKGFVGIRLRGDQGAVEGEKTGKSPDLVELAETAVRQ